MAGRDAGGLRVLRMVGENRETLEALRAFRRLAQKLKFDVCDRRSGGGGVVRIDGRSGINARAGAVRSFRRSTMGEARSHAYAWSKSWIEFAASNAQGFTESISGSPSTGWKLG